MKSKKRDTMNHHLKTLLYRSFDEKLSPEEQHQLASALNNFAELRIEKQQIEALRETLTGEPKPQFAPFFAERVMQRIHAERQSAREDDFFMSLIWTFRRVAIAGVIAVALLITTNILYKQDLSLDSILAVPQVTLENALELDELIVRE